MKQYWLERLQERSTWIAIITIFGSLFGSSLVPEKAEAFITAGMLIVGGAAAAMKEKK